MARLEAVLDHAGDVPGAKRQENLRKFRDQALLSRDLVRLDTHVPIALDWNAGRAGRIDVERALALFHDFGFRGIGQKSRRWRRRERTRGERRAREAGKGVSAGPSPLPPSAYLPCRRPPLCSPLTWSTPPRRSRLFWTNSGSRRRFRSIPRPPVFGRVGPSWSACRSPGTRARRGTCRSARRRPSGIWMPRRSLAALKPILEDPERSKRSART